MQSRTLALRAVVFSAALASFPLTASAIPLTNVWPLSTRGNIKVYVCTTTFATHIPNLDQTQLLANVQTALDVWNEHSGVDFYLNFSGARTGTSNGCGPVQNPGDGELTIKAEAMAEGRSQAGVTMGELGRNSVSFYARNVDGNIIWTFDHQDNNAELKKVLVHELGHVLGFRDIYSPPTATVMNGDVGAYQRVLWHEDIAMLRDVNQTKHYNVRHYTIRHKVSNDGALTWRSEGNLTEVTAGRIGVTYAEQAPQARKYLLAWRGTNVDTSLNVIQGNGAGYDASTKVVLPEASDYGPSVAFGNGKYLMVHVHRADSRALAYQVSSDGISWTGSVGLTYQGGMNYGSMWEPAVAYSNPGTNLFVVGWTNWQNVGDDNPLGKMRFCTSSDPQANGFSNCTESSNPVNASPSIACHPTANECLVSWTNHTGVSGHQLCWRKYQFNASNSFVPVDNSWCSGDSTKVSPALAYGQGRYVLGWRGSDSLTSANVARQSASDWPNWKNKNVVVSKLLTSPSLVFGNVWSEFAYYYLERP